MRRAAGGLVRPGELLSAGLEVVVPAKPASVASIHVHDDVGKVEVLQSVGDAVAVTRGRVLAGLQVDVGDQVGEGVRLDDKGKGRVGVRLDDLDDGVDVLRLVLGEFADRELAVGSLGSAVTAREVVDDDTQNVVTGGVSNGRIKTRNVCNGVTERSSLVSLNVLSGGR